MQENLSTVNVVKVEKTTIGSVMDGSVRIGINTLILFFLYLQIIDYLEPNNEWMDDYFLSFKPIAAVTDFGIQHKRKLVLSILFSTFIDVFSKWWSASKESMDFEQRIKEVDNDLSQYSPTYKT